MNVSEILDRVLEFALDEDDATTDLRDKALADVNQAYKYILGRIANRDLDYNVTSSNFTGVTASVTVPAHIKIYSVYDTTNGRKLVAKTLSQLEEMYPTMTDTGTSPRYYYMDGNTMRFMPIGTSGVNVRVRYYPVPAALEESDLEEDIKLPAFHDEALVSGAKWFMAQREDGFHDQGQVDRRFGEFDERTRELLRNLKSLTPVQKTTQGYYY